MKDHFKSLALCAMLICGNVQASTTTTFFNSSQSYSLDTTSANSNTLTSQGYTFTYTQDKSFNGGGGRPISTSWPDGLNVQALITTPPTGSAQVTIRRVDGKVFDLNAFSATLLGSTAATGASFEVTAKLKGNDLYPDPFMFSASGYTGTPSFNYGTTPNPLGSTAGLTGADTYKISLFTDFALTGLTLVDASTATLAPASIPVPAAFSLMLSGLGIFGSNAVRRRK